MAAHSFMNLNKLWLKLGADFSSVKPYLRNKLLTTVNKSLSIILKVDSKVKAVVVGIDLFDYKQLEDFPIYDNVLFSSLGRYGKTL